MRTAPAAAAVLAALLGCSYSLERDAGELRAEIAELERSVPPEAPLWISEGPDRFDRFLEDFTPRLPDFIHVHLLRKLEAMSAEELERQVQGDLDRSAFLEDPARFRGRVWRAHGVIARIRAETVEAPRLALRQYHAGVFFDRHGLPVYFHVLQKPDVLTLREDEVEIRGIFVKVMEYTAESGRRIVAPFFIGKVLRRFV